MEHVKYNFDTLQSIHTFSNSNLPKRLYFLYFRTEKYNVRKYFIGFSQLKAGGIFKTSYLYHATNVNILALNCIVV